VSGRLKTFLLIQAILNQSTSPSISLLENFSNQSPQIVFMDLWIRRAIDGHKHSKLQAYPDLRSKLIFTWYLAESMGCFDFLYFKPTKVRN
jgi:hypothetical protein